jgi:hypothetical protein
MRLAGAGVSESDDVLPGDEIFAAPEFENERLVERWNGGKVERVGDLGMARANISVGRNLYRIATGNSPQAAPAAMFWMKTRAAWKETVRQENTGPDGGPIEFKGMSARERIESRLARIRERMEEDKNP